MTAQAESPEFEMEIGTKLDRFTVELSFSCRPGEVLAVVGPSGAGKTTLLRIIAGFMHPGEGFIRLGDTVFFDKQAHIHLPPQGRRVGLVTQEYTLFPHMTIRENLAFAHNGGPDPVDLLEASGIAHLADRRPDKISGGERQRAALCRILAMSPNMLLLDEPFSALDIENRIILQEMIIKVGRERKIPIIHVTHDLSNALRYADRILAINEGREDRAWLDRQLEYLERNAVLARR
ncbi:ATP-binding cassette domain-containing protein [Sediminispirochaeta bajacaliforniensis]|uniref:ATP-binding cassette domain-containing protein n=1 Tax=Sediminispirochaeta bajacaliforniensis TaxID=148 RepID=UPI0003669DD5|nr:ATP-binding cassette domain-containing protein [Sediminispirochaeta bajacaliforniensis]